MVASGISAWAAAMAAAALSTSSNRAYADSPFRNPFSSELQQSDASNSQTSQTETPNLGASSSQAYQTASPNSIASNARTSQAGYSPFRRFSTSTASQQSEDLDPPTSETAPGHNDPKGRPTGLDPESLERGAKALRDINNNPYNKQIYQVMGKQEDTRQAWNSAEEAKREVEQEIQLNKRQKEVVEEQFNMTQQDAQSKAQKLRYEDELTRQRMKLEHEAHKKHNAELVRMQEESSVRKEKTRAATESEIQARQRQTEKQRAEIERETIRVKAMAEAEARALEIKMTEDQNRRRLVDQVNGEREKWIAAINATFSHIEAGFRMLLEDRSKLIMTVGGATALAAGVYTTREGARVGWGYINRILGQPSLIRESSVAKFPWSGIAPRGLKALKSQGSGGSKPNLGNVILHPSLKKRIEQLARATANTKSHQAPFRNMLFYGPPGTGKTLVAREIARKSGLDYATMTGGDVAPLGAKAVTKIHDIFDWGKNSRKGLLLFIDEADAFLCERNSTYMSEAQRSALNALLYRTGDQSRDICLVLATNRPGDLDGAVTDRIDEVLEFPLPGEEERFKLLKLYLTMYLSNEGDNVPSWRRILPFFMKKKSNDIVVKDLTEDVIREVAKKTEGFSGREVAKLVASVQAAVYGRPDCVLDAQLFKEVVEYKVAEHHQRIELATEGGLPA